MRQSGLTLLELLVTLSLVLILGGIAIPQMMQFNSASQNAAALIASFSKQVRAKAIASTSAYRMKPSGSGTLITEYAINCNSSTWTADIKNRLYLPNNSSLVGTNWDICFNSRGLPDGNLEITVREQTGGTKTVEIMLGGATRVI